MKLTHLSLGLALLLPIGLIGCGSGSETSSTDTTTSTDTSSKDTSAATDTSKGESKVVDIADTGFQISIPSTWKTEEDKEAVDYTSPNEDIVIEVRPAKNPAAIVTTFKDMMKEKEYKNYKEDGAPESMKVGGIEATGEKGTVEDGDHKLVWEIVTVKRGKTPIVIWSAVDKVNEKSMDEYNAVLNTLNFKG